MVFCNQGPPPLLLAVTPALPISVAGTFEYEVGFGITDDAHDVVFDLVQTLSNVDFRNDENRPSWLLRHSEVSEFFGTVEHANDGDHLKAIFNIQHLEPGSYVVVVRFRLGKGPCESRTWTRAIGLVNWTGK